MATKKAVEAAPVDDTKPCDFVYVGRRVAGSGKLCMTLRQKLTHGLGDERLFNWAAHHARFVIGGEYTGARFNETQVRALDTARYVGMYKGNDVLIWTAKDEEAAVEVAAAKLAARQKRAGNSFDKQLQELRQAYHKLITWTDREAFKRAVTRSLERPLKLERQLKKGE